MALTVLDRFYLLDDGFFSFNIKYLFFVGLWPEEGLTKTQKIFYRIYEIFIHMLTIIFMVLTAIGTYQHKEDLTILFSNLDKCLVAYNFYLKTVIFFIKRGQLRNLIDEMEASGDDVSEEKKKMMAKYVVLLTGISTAVVGAFSLLALFEGEMTIEAWMPFNPKANTMNLILSIQIIAFTIMPCLCRAFAMQGLVCSLIMYLCDQLIHLQNELKCMKYSKEFDIIVRLKLKEIIMKHVRLMRYSMTMESIFKEYFLVQNLAITIELCLNAIMVTVVGVQQLTLLITFVAYLCIALINAYVYCYLGNELIIQSEGIALAAYESTWISWPLDLQKDLLILIKVAQRPLKLSAGGMALLSIRTFGQDRPLQTRHTSDVWMYFITCLSNSIRNIGLMGLNLCLVHPTSMMVANVNRLASNYMRLRGKLDVYHSTTLLNPMADIFLMALYNGYSIFAVLNDTVN